MPFLKVQSSSETHQCEGLHCSKPILPSNEHHSTPTAWRQKAEWFMPLFILHLIPQILSANSISFFFFFLSLKLDTSEPWLEQGLQWGGKSREVGELSPWLCLQEGLFWGKSLGVHGSVPWHRAQAEGAPSCAGKGMGWGTPANTNDTCFILHATFFVGAPVKNAHG